MNAATGIGDVFERSKRIGDRIVSVADLVYVFDQLNGRAPVAKPAGQYDRPACSDCKGQGFLRWNKKGNKKS